MAWNPTTMQWDNAAYMEQASPDARLSMARAYITELNNAITSRISGSGESVDPGTVVELLKIVKDDLKDLQREANAAAGVGLPRMIPLVTRDRRH
jgi:hypothetical protein